jgi:hypothetical protein
MKGRIAAIVGLSAVAVAAVLSEAIRLLLVGWVVFLWRNLWKVTVNPAGVATGVVAILLLLGATHYFCHGWRRAMPGDSDSPRRPWRFRWTLSIVILLLVMFAAGFSAIGLARQLGWLLSSQ